MMKNALFIKELPDGWEKAWKELWRDLPASNNLMYMPVKEWNKFPDNPPEESDTYDVVVAHEKGSHVETAEYSSSRKAFIWYSRRGYPYEIEVTHWKALPPLPSMEDEQHDPIS